MALPAAITGTTTFNRVTNYIIYEDTTDWAAEGIDFNVGDTVVETITVSYQTSSGTVVAGSGTIDPNVATSGNICLIPLTGDDKPLPTNYTVEVSAVVTPFGGAAGTFTKSFSYTYSLTDPTMCLETTINCSGGTITSEDTTDYGSYSSLTRAHTLYPPPASGASAVTANLSEITATTLYTTTWTASCISTVTYVGSDGLVVIAELQGTKEVAVLCDNNLNKIECCLEKLNDNYNYLVDSGSLTQAKVMLETRINPTFRALSLYLTALTAGNANKMQKNYTAMLNYSGCSEDCGCSSTVPSLVVPTTTSTTNFVVDSPDNSIAVVPDINGTITTFHIQVSAALQAAIGNLHNTTVTSNDGTVTVTPSGNKNYDLSIPVNNNTLVNQLVKHLLLTNTTGNFTLSVSDLINSGTAWIANASQVYAKSATATDIAVITCTNFINLNALSAIVDYVASSNIMRVNAAAVNTNTANIVAEVFWFDETADNGDLRIRITDNNGTPYTWADLSTIADNIDIALTFMSEPTQ